MSTFSHLGIDVLKHTFYQWISFILLFHHYLTAGPKAGHRTCILDTSAQLRTPLHLRTSQSPNNHHSRTPPSLEKRWMGEQVFIPTVPTTIFGTNPRFSRD